MPSQLVSSSGCCQPCDTDPVVVNVPGPQGAAGANGSNGTNGADSFSYTTAQFTVPAFGVSVVVPLAATSFLPESVAGQFFVSVQGCGYLQVTDVTGLNVTLKNPLAGVLGIPNAIPTTIIPTNALVTLAGALGATGATGAAGDAPKTASYICRTQDATLTNETALELLAAGYMKTLGSTGVGAVTTSAVVPVADIFGTLPIAKGGTNLITSPLNKIPVGDGTTYLQKEIIASSPIVVTNTAGNITISAPSIAGFNYVTFTRRVTSNSPQISVTANPFNSTTYPLATYSGIDTASAFTAATGRFVAPYSGYYRISSLIQPTAVGGACNMVVSIRKNNIPIYTCLAFRVPFAITSDQPVFVEFIDQASASDFYEIYLSSAVNDFYLEIGSSFSIQRIQA